MAIGAVGAELMEEGNLSVEYHQKFLVVVVVGFFGAAATIEMDCDKDPDRECRPLLMLVWMVVGGAFLAVARKTQREQPVA